MENKIVNTAASLLPEQFKENWSIPEFNLISISNGTLGKNSGSSDAFSEGS